MTATGCPDCLTPRDPCTECRRPIANEHDEGAHNTGGCGCEHARSLCWRRWNGNVCAPLSPYDPDSRTARGTVDQ